jgi:hypothetical protein
LIVHGMRSITSHSTAFFSITLKTANTLLTVFGAFVSRPPLVVSRQVVEIQAHRS